MEDLKGKAIAVSAPGSFPDVLARASLAKYKLGPSDVKLAAVGGDRDRYTALIGGVVDAAVVTNEYVPLPSSQNLKMLLEGKEALPNLRIAFRPRRHSRRGTGTQSAISRASRHC
jgi:NitT/TauT family transport system substrate-binding protein